MTQSGHAHAGRKKCPSVDDATELVAFISEDRTGGTEDTIKRAHAKGIPVDVR
jgi:hypothetical protein